MTDDSLKRKIRWRLVLGQDANGGMGGTDGILDTQSQGRDQALEYLYGREYGKRNVRRGGSGGKPSGDDHGSLDPSQLSVPDWINAVHELFPQRTIERL